MGPHDHDQYLEIHDHRGAIQRYLLTKGPVILGRGTDAQVRLDGADVSRHHAEMEVDELRRWTIRDLKSRHGVIVNGERIACDEMDKHWQLVEPGDEVQIGTYRMVLMVSTPAVEQAMGQELSYFNVDMQEKGDENTKLTTMEGAGQGAIQPAQLQAIGLTGLRLVQTKSAVKRLRYLFEFVTSGVIGGQVAMAMRVSKVELTRPPQMLMPPMLAKSWPLKRRPHVSRRTVRAVLARGEAVLAGGIPGAPKGVELSVAPDVPSAVIAAPLRSSEDSLDLLYVVVPPELGTTDCLAVISLAARQFEIAEAAKRLAHL
ncbi:MAG: FHA domain-containing protein [Phycisphaeraceae bacterium]